MDMWAAYVNLFREHAPNAKILFGRFHREASQRGCGWGPPRAMAPAHIQTESHFQGDPLVAEKPWNLKDNQKDRLSTLVRWNTPLVRARYLKEAFQLFWSYKQPGRATQHLLKWMNSAVRSKLEPFEKFVRRLRSHLDGVLA
jgi:transposase